MPAGNRLKYRSNIPAYAQYVFEREAPEFATRAAKFRDEGLGTVIVGLFDHDKAVESGKYFRRRRLKSPLPARHW